MTRNEICQKHWKQLGITDEKSLKNRITAIFEIHEHQADVLIDLYKLVFPDWDRIEKIEGHPEVGRTFWKFVFSLFSRFDRKHHPKVYPGGLWFNTGFSSSNQLNPWEISFKTCTVIND